MKKLPLTLGLLLLPSLVWAGHSRFPYFDGGQSADGRFVVTAERVELPSAGKRQPTGYEWRFTWRDKQTGETRSGLLVGLTSGTDAVFDPVHAHTFVAPDGESFAVWNPHVCAATDPPKQKFPADLAAADARDWTGFSHRLVVYRKTGEIIARLDLKHFLAEDDWRWLFCYGRQVYWQANFAGLTRDNAPRVGYALYQISPDYTVLETLVGATAEAAHQAREKGITPPAPRLVRVNLLDGQLLDPTAELPPEKTPGRPFIGELSKRGEGGQASYLASLDPVRIAGSYADDKAQSKVPPPAEPIAKQPALVAPAAPKFLPARLIQDGFAKLDTPTWLVERQWLVFTDLDQGKQFKLIGDKEVSEIGPGGRGKVAADGKTWVGIAGDSLVRWDFSETKPVQLRAAPSLNDIAIDAPAGRAYFTTLKDPEKGRLTLVNLQDGAAAVVWDREQESSLVNPNGVALSPDGQLLYVGISSYANRKLSGIYRFPVLPDGSLDVPTGKQSKWYAANGPDGLAVDPAGNVFITLGGNVVIVSSEGKKIGELKIPRGSGTNLCFGGPKRDRLYVTTFTALYVYESAPR
ncbi:MAG: SMP-30/gluconolactonase/LRE family protein [Pirellulaceae bacterium]|nr:SMP-30/gluconolactonase/LRE family protein [Pirellulaceae bacterium]